MIFLHQVYQSLHESVSKFQSTIIVIHSKLQRGDLTRNDHNVNKTKPN
jgi:hypothetical protein